MADGDHGNLSRRDFIKSTAAIVGGIIGAGILLPAIGFLFGPAWRKDEDNALVDLGPLDQYPIGTPRFSQFTRTKVNGWERTGMSYGVFVVRPDETQVHVLSNICTHLGCHVAWHPNLRHYVSPCHDGHFDILGKNISGPPPRPLDEFKTKIEGGRLFIQLPPFRRTA